jgi:hypothetical protein
MKFMSEPHPSLMTAYREGRSALRSDEEDGSVALVL